MKHGTAITRMLLHDVVILTDTDVVETVQITVNLCHSTCVQFLCRSINIQSSTWLGQPFVFLMPCVC